MFFHVDIKGDRLPDRTLCLTYDDGPGQVQGNGPGPRTLELAEYLFERGVPATFFVIGKHLELYPQLPGQLSQMGHLVGNHTSTHPGLVALAVGGGNVCDELLENRCSDQKQRIPAGLLLPGPVRKLARAGRRGSP